MKSTRGQAVLWVIVAMAIVTLLGVLFLFKSGPEGGAGKGFDVESYIRQCVSDNVLEVVDEVLPHGGFAENRKFKIFNNISVEYLCYNQGYFKPCINQRPAYFDDVAKNIEKNVSGKIKICFDNLDNELRNRGAEVSGGAAGFKIGIVPDTIVIKLNRSMEVTEKGVVRGYDNFNFEIPSPLYSLVRAALEIANSEAKYCYFEYVGYMILNPNLIIEKNNLGDSTKIYSIRDVKSKQKLNIAIRGCAIPPGI